MRPNIYHPVRCAILVFLAASAAACGGGEDPPGAGDSSVQAEHPVADPSGLTAEQIENGIGPISSLDLAALDPALAATGEEVFALKCSACHRLGERYVGPPLGQVLGHRTPEFVMNMMLNPDEMVARHPEVQKLLAQFYTPMPDQQLTEEDARAVLEYLRQAEQAGGDPTTTPQ